MDAIVIGAGPNGLVAANLLADRGWKVLVLEEQPEPGGAVKTAELTHPGFKHDVFSAFYPLAAASPVMRSLELEQWGLRWCRAPVAVGHPTRAGAALMYSGDIERTAAGLGDAVSGDDDAWRDLFALWTRGGEHIVRALFDSPFPPVREPVKLVAALRQDFLRFSRLALTSVRRLSEERFHGDGPGLLLAGNAMHADLTTEMPLGAFLGFLLCGLAQTVGYPTPEGGAGSLTEALVRRLTARGGEISCGRRVDEIEVRAGRAVGIGTADGDSHPAGRAVIADVSAVALYGDLISSEHLPARIGRDMARFRYDNATVKVDWALDKTCPWTFAELGQAGTVHTGDDIDHIGRATGALARGTVPARPPLVIGQMDAADPTRSPEGAATMWAYAHVPQRIADDEGGTIAGKWDEAEKDAFAERIEQEIERHAPGFRDAITARHVMGPHDLERADRNLVGGAVNGGTAQLRQQLFLRPIPGSGRPETPIRGLYLASASAHPGGGVHGACGANAARAALLRDQAHKLWSGWRTEG